MLSALILWPSEKKVNVSKKKKKSPRVNETGLATLLEAMLNHEKLWKVFPRSI